MSPTAFTLKFFLFHTSCPHFFPVQRSCFANPFFPNPQVFLLFPQCWIPVQVWCFFFTVPDESWNQKKNPNVHVALSFSTSGAEGEDVCLIFIRKMALCLYTWLFTLFGNVFHRLHFCVRCGAFRRWVYGADSIWSAPGLETQESKVSLSGIWPLRHPLLSSVLTINI